MGQLDRITQQPDVMGGKACIRGMRVTVSMIVSQIGAGHGVDEILGDYPTLREKTSCRRCGMPHGVPKSARLCWQPHEVAHRHEPVSAMG